MKDGAPLRAGGGTCDALDRVMRVLVTWGSRRGGTAGIGQVIADALRARGVDVVAAPVAEVREVEPFDAAIIGGALYANRWHAGARRFINRHAKGLRRIPVWLFSSGPLDDAADRTVIPATTEVAVLAERIGARRHVTFGGRLAPNAKGFPASAMAKTRSGDWRNPDRARAWAAEIADVLPVAAPGRPVDHPARSVVRLTAYGLTGWAACAATMAALTQIAGATIASVVHDVAAPAIFVALGRRYFRARGARDPLPTAAAWTAIVAGLDGLVIAGGVPRSLAMFGSLAGTWLPLALIFLATWATGALMATMPWPRTSEAKTPRPAPHRRHLVSQRSS
jgi:menaquinone-dependent protoporphyrinogen oxidase